jgi:uncharacterized protein YcfJ
MGTRVWFLALTGAGMMLLDAAAQAGSFSAKGRVTDVEPVYREVQVVTPEKTCWTSGGHSPGGYVTHRRHQQSYTPVIAGAIVGGVLGNQVGKGRGRDVATVAGALLGGSIGHDLSYTTRHHDHHRPQRHCEITENVSYRNELIGYDVTYRYQGRLFTLFMDHKPGKFVDLDVDVHPGREQYDYDEHQRDTPVGDWH